MSNWLKHLFSHHDGASSTRFVTVITVFYVFVMGGLTIFTGRFDSDVAGFLFGMFSVAIIGKTTSKFKEKPPSEYGSNSYDKNPYQGRSYEDERG